MANYTIQKFPFREGMYAAMVTNTDTGKHCKFMVTAATVDPRSPTPGFPGKNEMDKDEVKAELSDMVKAIRAAE